MVTVPITLPDVHVRKKRNLSMSATDDVSTYKCIYVANVV